MFKVCRNIAQFYPACIETLEANMGNYFLLCAECGENTDLMLELLGTLVYMPTDRWFQTMEEHDILGFL